MAGKPLRVSVFLLKSCTRKSIAFIYMHLLMYEQDLISTVKYKGALLSGYICILAFLIHHIPLERITFFIPSALFGYEKQVCT